MSFNALYQMLDGTCSSLKKLYQPRILNLYNFLSWESIFFSYHGQVFSKSLLNLRYIIDM